ncbi:hypothetical protein [Streptomyces erythrochromogenes]|uniref:hypothetical protein n=1 Tax=Streptomyces erythrochromogenes TaxID=285574 RepID=UPI0037F6187D
MAHHRVRSPVIVAPDGPGKTPETVAESEPDPEAAAAAAAAAAAEAAAEPDSEEAHGDYTGAVYGSLLAASVVVGAGTLGSFPRLQLIVLLLGTGVVFWAAHVFARLFGARLLVGRLSWSVVRRVSRQERPIIEAAVPPAAAAAITPLFDLGPQGIAWLALLVALAGQVGWATVAAKRAGASRRLMVVAGAINLFLGLLIVLLKVGLQH